MGVEVIFDTKICVDVNLHVFHTSCISDIFGSSDFTRSNLDLEKVHNLCSEAQDIAAAWLYYSDLLQHTYIC